MPTSTKIHFADANAVFTHPGRAAPVAPILHLWVGGGPEGPPPQRKGGFNVLRYHKKFALEQKPTSPKGVLAWINVFVGVGAKKKRSARIGAVNAEALGWRQSLFHLIAPPKKVACCGGTRRAPKENAKLL